MPLPEEDDNEDARIEPFSEAELRNILKKASPQAWRETQEKSNIRFDSVSAQVQYYEKLRNIDERRQKANPHDRRSNGNNNKSNSKKNNRKGGRGSHSSNGNHSNNDAPCPIHGNSHTIGQCNVIQAERNKYKNKNSSNNSRGSGNNNNRGGNNSNNANANGNRNNHRYNTRSRRNNEENNNVNATHGSNPNSGDNGSDSEEGYAIEEELNVLSESIVEEEVKAAVKAVGSTKSNGSETTSPTTTPKGSDVRVQLSSKTSSGSRKHSTVLGLLDTGASSNFVPRSTLKHVSHTLEPVNVRVKGRYSSTIIKEQAKFQVRLPDFAASKTIEVTALVEDNNDVIGRHDIIFGSTFLQELGITFDYSRGTIGWDDVSTTMKTIPPNEINSLNDEDPGDVHLPNFMKAANNRSSIMPNIYQKYNYRDMVLKCEHLSCEQQDILIDLFSQYEDLFSGDLGSVPGPPVSLKLKPNAKPFASRAYTVPKALEHIAKKEVNDLVDIGVLVEGVASEWASPSFFRPKKDGQVRFVSDLRKLNACLECHPYPLPLIEEVIWKMNGFQFATCLDLN
jgi:hypothetical protein